MSFFDSYPGLFALIVPYFLHLQGGVLNRGLKRFFSMYRPSCHIEAYIRPEKYCFVWAGPLANHHSILTSFFSATAERGGGKSGMFCRSGPPLSGPIPQRWTDVGSQN